MPTPLHALGASKHTHFGTDCPGSYDRYSQPIGSNYLESERYLKEVLQRVPLKEIGDMVQTHRKAMRFSIRDLAERAMVSKSSIVSLEQGKSCRPSTLAKVCTAMNLHLERFTSPSKPSESTQVRLHSKADEQWFSLDELISGQLPVATLEERLKLHQAGSSTQMMMFKNVPAGAGFIAGIIEISGKTEPRSHSGIEFVYALRGRAVVTIEDQDFVLETGDAVTIFEFENHSYAPAPDENNPISLLSFREG